MTDPFNQPPRPTMTLEAFRALHPELGVTQSRLGDIVVTADPGSRGEIEVVNIFRGIVAGDPSRPAISLSARRAGEQRYTYLTIPCDAPDQISSTGAAGLDPGQIFQMARDGMELFDAHSALSDEDRRGENRVYSWMDSAEQTYADLRPLVHDLRMTDVTSTDAAFAWHVTFHEPF